MKENIKKTSFEESFPLSSPRMESRKKNVFGRLLNETWETEEEEKEEDIHMVRGSKRVGSDRETFGVRLSRGGLVWSRVGQNWQDLSEPTQRRWSSSISRALENWVLLKSQISEKSQIIQRCYHHLIWWWKPTLRDKLEGKWSAISSSWTLCSSPTVKLLAK